MMCQKQLLVTYGDIGKRFSERRVTAGRLVRDPAGDWDGYPDVLLYDSGHPDQANPSSAEVAPGRGDAREGVQRRDDHQDLSLGVEAFDAGAGG